MITNLLKNSLLEVDLLLFSASSLKVAHTHCLKVFGKIPISLYMLIFSFHALKVLPQDLNK